MSAQERTEMMLNAPVSRVIPRLAIPTIISMLITSIYNMADTFFVSQLGTSASGAVGVIFSAMAIIQAVAFMIGMGSGTNVSQALGAGDEERARRFASTGFFTAFGVGKNEYQHVLNWGILGAIVLRFVFIFLGAAIISRFDWVLLVFGGVLIYSGVKMFLDRNKKEEMDVQKNPIVRLLSKTGRIHTQFEGDRFFIRKAGRLLFTPLFVTVLVIEFSDLIFAFDSIPAVFSVSLDPYVVFFSNIFAILGLRAMFFLLAAIADRFRYLKTGVCVLLLFIGVKMLIHEWVEIDAVASLCIILAVLVVSIGASLLPQRKKA